MEVGLAGTDVPEEEAAGAAGVQPAEDAGAGRGVATTGVEEEPPSAADRDHAAAAAAEASAEEPSAEEPSAEKPPAEAVAEPAGEDRPPALAREQAPAEEPSAEAGDEPAVAVSEPAVEDRPPAVAHEQASDEEPSAEGGEEPAEAAPEPSAEVVPPGAVEGSAAEETPAAPEPLPAGPVGPVRASSMDSTTLPDRSRHEAESLRQRHRRSAARLPALVTPVDIPEDAEGRIDIVVIRAAPDRDEPGSGEPAVAAPVSDRVRDLLTMGSGWVAVGGLAALLIVVFVVLELLYR